MDKPLIAFNPTQAKIWYDGTRAWFFTINALVFPTCFFINAPFGRFAPSSNSIFLVDGIKSWIIMEIVSPIMCTTAFLSRPLSPSSTPSPHRMLLAALFLTHYANRALISPLRTPSRSKSHIIVPLAAVFFNFINGSLMGSFLASPGAVSPYFYPGIALWALGFAGNIVHDEMLLNIRRRAKVKKEKDGDEAKKGEHYAIPHGLLYEYVSYPNYFCEWLEWLGFALAAGPIPALSSLQSISVASITQFGASLLNCLISPSTCASFAPGLSPPWLFLIIEIFTMAPRAYAGHLWYHGRFPDYPKERRAVIPWLF